MTRIATINRSSTSRTAPRMAKINLTFRWSKSALEDCLSSADFSSAEAITAFSLSFVSDMSAPVSTSLSLALRGVPSLASSSFLVS